ncbi:MAG: chloride channel protein [Rikenellaceae bacterium]
MNPYRYERIYSWVIRLSRRLSERQMMMVLAVIVGLLAGFATYVFEWLLHLIKGALVSWLPNDESHIIYLFYPIMGIILVTLFVKHFVRDNISEGVTRVLYAISRKGSNIKSHNNWTSVAASATTLGFGGSVGPEAPIVLTGASIGSNVGKLARLNYKNTTLLLCCGAGAALAAIFKAPITGVLFVLEILMLDITVGSVIPLLIASVTGATLAIMLRGFTPILAITLTEADSFNLGEIPLFILLGVICGLMGFYLTNINERVGALYKKLDSQYKKWIVGGVIIGLLIFIFPPLYGEGYDGITALMHGDPAKLFNDSLFYKFRHVDWAVILFVLATMLFKVIAMASTTAAGGVGGTFAPSLFLGAFSGAFVALTFNFIFGWDLSIVSFTLVGMSGVMSGVMNAPLTSIFLIAELSGGYELFIPLMIVASISFAINYYFEPESIYTKPLSKKGELLTHDKDRSTLVFLNLDDLMETDFVTIKPFYTLGDLVQIISTGKRNIFPVVNEFGKLRGVVQLDDIREDMFKPENYGVSILKYMSQPPDKIIEHEQINSILSRFEQNKTWMLPVIKSDNTYLGFISKSRILASYREHLIKISQ